MQVRRRRPGDIHPSILIAGQEKRRKGNQFFRLQHLTSGVNNTRMPCMRADGAMTGTQPTVRRKAVNRRFGPVSTGNRFHGGMKNPQGGGGRGCHNHQHDLTGIIVAVLDIVKHRQIIYRNLFLQQIGHNDSKEKRAWENCSALTAYGGSQTNTR